MPMAQRMSWMSVARLGLGGGSRSWTSPSLTAQTSTMSLPHHELRVFTQMSVKTTPGCAPATASLDRGFDLAKVLVGCADRFHFARTLTGF